MTDDFKIARDGHYYLFLFYNQLMYKTCDSALAENIIKRAQFSVHNAHRYTKERVEVSKKRKIKAAMAPLANKEVKGDSEFTVYAKEHGEAAQRNVNFKED